MHDANPILYQTEDWEGDAVAMGSVVKRGIAGETDVPPLGSSSSGGAAGGGGSSSSSPPAAHCPPDCGPPANGKPVTNDPVTNATYFLWYSSGSDSAKFPGQAWSVTNFVYKKHIFYT